MRRVAKRCGRPVAILMLGAACGGCFGYNNRAAGYADRTRSIRIEEWTGLAIAGWGFYMFHQLEEGEDQFVLGVEFSPLGAALLASTGLTLMLHAESRDTKWSTYIYGRKIGKVRADPAMDRALENARWIGYTSLIVGALLPATVLGQDNSTADAVYAGSFILQFYGLYKLTQSDAYRQELRHLMVTAGPEGPGLALRWRF